VRPSLTFWVLLAIAGIVAFHAIKPRVHQETAILNHYQFDIHGGIKTALDSYEVDNGYYPKSLQDLLQQPSGATNWHGPYLPGPPVDPWGHKYIYEYPGKHNTNGYDLSSAGPDGKPGTGDDIGSWMN
jgi:general secretion pathway protein G